MKRAVLLMGVLFALGLSACAGTEFAPPPTSTPAPTASAVPAPTPVPPVETEVDLRPQEIRVLCQTPESVTAPCFAEVFETLYTCKDGELIPLLAVGEIEREEGKNDYFVSLQQNLADSEGNSFSPEQVAKIYQTHAQKEESPLLSAEVSGDGKILLHFCRELSKSEEISWLCNIPLYGEKAGNEGSSIFKLAGTGTYKISSLTQEEMLLVPNEHSRNKERQNVQSIRYLLVDDPVEQVIYLETEKADMALSLPYEQAEDFLPNGSYADLFKTVDCYSSVGRYLLPNVGKGSVLSSQELRLAVFACLDDNAMAEKLCGRSCYGLGNKDCIELNESVPLQSFVEGNGTLPSPKPRLTLLCPATGEGRLMAETVRSQWENHGLLLVLLPLDEQEYHSALQSGEGWDVTLVETSGSISALSHWVELWDYHEGASTLRGNLSDGTMVKLFRELENGKSKDIESFQKYVYTQALAYALPQMNRPAIIPASLSETEINCNGTLLPGACHYA